MKKLLLFILITAVTAVSCGKESSEDSTPKVVESFDALTVAPNFNWETRSEITLHFKAIPNLPIERLELLEVKQKDKVLFRQLVNLQKDVAMQLEIPSRLKQITIAVGALEKTVNIQSGQAEFSMLQDEDLSDLDPQDR